MNARIVRLGKLGKRLEGPAIGKLLAKFLNNCYKENMVAIIDCSGVERIGAAVIKNIKLFSGEKPEIYIVDACEEVAAIIQTLK